MTSASPPSPRRKGRISSMISSTCSRRRASAAVRSVESEAPKDVPQPQELVAFGLWKVNPEEVSVSV